MSADLLTRLIEAGTPAKLIAEVAMLAARADAAAQPDPAAERRRAWDRTYRAKRRAAEKAASGGCRVDTADIADIADAAPFLDKETLPPTPPIKEIKPTPCGGTAHARLRSALAGIDVLIAGMVQLQAQAAVPRRSRRDAPKRRWPHDMPPPPSVSDDQWAGVIDHRIAKRQRLTPRGYELLCRKLAEFAEAGWPPGEAIDRAVERGWLTVFPPDEKKLSHDHGSRNHRSRSGNGLLDAVLDAERAGGA